MNNVQLKNKFKPLSISDLKRELAARRSEAEYYYGDGVTFILTDKKTVVCTNLQTFLVRHDHRNYIKQLERLREMIMKNEMRSLPDLITYCGYKPGGYNDQMCGLELVPTRLERLYE